MYEYNQEEAPRSSFSYNKRPIESLQAEQMTFNKCLHSLAIKQRNEVASHTHTYTHTYYAFAYYYI